MIRVRIADQEQRYEDADESWVNQQINRRAAAGQIVCVQVSIEEDGVQLRLRTPTCGPGGGGGRPPTRKEQEIFELWDRCGLNEMRFTGGNVVSFL